MNAGLRDHAFVVRFYSLKGRGVNWLHFAIHAGVTYIVNFWHSGTLALNSERKSARMSEINNVG